MSYSASYAVDSFLLPIIFGCKIEKAAAAEQSSGEQWDPTFLQRVHGGLRAKSFNGVLQCKGCVLSALMTLIFQTNRSAVFKMSDAIHIAQVVTLYWIVSISMVYLNKILLTNADASIPAPMFVTWFQCVVTAVVCVLLGNMGERTRKEGRSSFLNDYPKCVYNRSTGVNVLPLSLIFVAMIAFNNICLKHVEVSFYNVARSLSIVFNVIFTYLVLGRETSVMTCSTLLVVIFGFYLGIDGEINLSIFGTAAGVLASIFVSLNGIYTAKILPVVNNDKSMLLFYNNVNASFLFLPFIVLFEGQVRVRS